MMNYIAFFHLDFVSVQRRALKCEISADVFHGLGSCSSRGVIWVAPFKMLLKFEYKLYFKSS